MAKVSISMTATISFIIPTVGRTSLKRTLDSIESWPGDEILVIQHIPPLGGWGAHERNEGIAKATCNWLSFIDDDDQYTPGHRQIMDQAIKANSKGYPIIFRMKYPDGQVEWDRVRPRVRCGHIKAPMIFVPNVKESMQAWRPVRITDFRFVNDLGWRKDGLVWCSEIIALIGHNKEVDAEAWPENPVDWRTLPELSEWAAKLPRF